VLRPRGAASAGLTLIETLASILIFSIITIGITPLLVGSLRGSALSRSYSVGKNLSNRVLERARGLPYFQSVRDQNPPVRRDVFDTYFPDLVTSTGYSGAPNYTYTTLCTGTPALGTRAAIACPANRPTGYTATIVTRFVRAVVVGGVRQYVAAAPATGYNWSSALTETGPTNLLEIRITSAWTTMGRNQTYTLTSFLGDRRLTPELYSADARLNYAVRALASYVGTESPNAGATSQLEAIALTAQSTINNRTTSTADQTTSGGRITLIRTQDTSDADPTLDSATGVTGSLRAPPSATSTDLSYTGGYQGGTGTGAGEIRHPHLSPTFGDAGYLDDHTITGSRTAATIQDGTPQAGGALAFNSGTAVGTGAGAMFVNNQFEKTSVAGQETQLQLDPLKNIFSTERQSGGNHITACTSATAIAGTPSTGCSPTNAAGSVSARVGATVKKIRLFPVSFIAGSGGADTSVIVIDNFTATATCSSTSSPAANATATASWSATLKIWTDSNPADDLTVGAYQSFSLAGSTGTPPADALATLGNPLILDRAGTSLDVYLFKDASRPLGYLSQGGLKAPTIIASSANVATRTASVTLSNAIELVTVPTDPNRPETTLTIDVGSLSCASVDKRGL